MHPSSALCCGCTIYTLDFGMEAELRPRLGAARPVALRGGARNGGLDPLFNTGSGGRGTGSAFFLVGFAAVDDAQDEDHQFAIVDLEKDAVVAGTESIGVLGG